MEITPFVLGRYTTKAFDPDRKISPGIASEIETLLRFSPSSSNSQPWRFIIASTEEGKARIAKATAGSYAFNESKIKDASHVVVFCARAAIDEAHLREVLDQETQDGRLLNEEDRVRQHKGRSYFVDMHRYEYRDAQHWMEKQVYLALGTLLLGASVLGVDACPIEGFDKKILDEELGLHQQGFISSVIVALGYHSDSDFNAKLPKSRLPEESILTRL